MKMILLDIKMKLYCFIVNKNSYVRDAYQLPVDLNPDYHKNHRVIEWIRLCGLIFKYRVLHIKPSEEEVLELEEMRKKRFAKQNLEGDLESFKILNDTDSIREIFEEAIKKIEGADILRFSDYENVLTFGNDFDGEKKHIANEMYNAYKVNGLRKRIVWIGKQNDGSRELIPAFDLPVDIEEDELYIGKTCHFLAYEERIIEQSEYLKQTCEILKQLYCTSDANYIKFIVVQLYNYFISIFESFKPSLVMLWKGYGLNTNIVKQVIEDYGAKCIYLENDELPEAFSLDLYGHGEESYRGKYTGWKARCDAIDPTLFINARDIFTNERTIKLRNWDRNIELSSFSYDRPTVLFCGFDDIENRMYLQATGKMEQNLSLYCSSSNTANYISSICKRNRWNFIYKPFRDANKENFTGKKDNVIDGTDVDLRTLIDICNVVVSATNHEVYTGLAMEKPVVLLGKMQLSGQGCCYEAQTYNDIPILLERAVHLGLQEEQKLNFSEVITYLQRYYIVGIKKNDERYKISISQALLRMQNEI